MNKAWRVHHGGRRIVLVLAALSLLFVAPGGFGEPKPPSPKELKVRRHLHMAQYFRLHERDPKLALKEYKAALRLHKTHLVAGLGAADAMMVTKDFKGARKLLDRLGKAHPKNARVIGQLARLHELSGDPALALASLKTAVRLNPRDAKSHHQIAKILLGRYRRGETGLKAELALHFRLYQKFGRYKNGLDAAVARRVLAQLEGGKLGVIKSDAVANYEAAFKTRRIGKINALMEKAHGLLATCLKVDPKAAACHYYLGLVRQSVKASKHYDIQGAIRSFNNVPKGPFFVESRIELARFYRRTDDLAAAEAALGGALKFNPNHLQAHLEAGIVYKLDGRDDEAVEHLVKVYKTNPFSHLARKAVSELAQVRPDHPYVQAAWRFGVMSASGQQVFSSERYKSAMKILEKRFGGVAADAPEKAVLESILKRLIEGGEIDPQQTFKVEVLSTKIVNAMATPNGNIYFTRGFFDFLKRDWPNLAIDADHPVLGHVMAHEIVHVLRRHTVSSQLFRQAAKASGRRISPGVLVHVTRIHEIEADREGMVLAFLAGYHPRGGIDFMEARGRKREIPTHLDHPTYDERVHYLEEFWSNEVKYAYMSFEFGRKKLEEAKAIEEGQAGDLLSTYRAAADHFNRFESHLRPVRESMNNLSLAYLKMGLLKLGSTDSALNRWQSPLSIEASLGLKFVAVTREEGPLAKRSAQEASKDGAPLPPRPIPFEIHQSIRLLKKVVRRYPNYAKAWVNLAAAYLAARELALAQKVLAERPGHADSPEGTLLRGILLAEAKDYVGATAAFKTAAKSDDVTRAARYNAARLAEISGRQVEAKKAYQRYIEAYPKGLWTQSAKRALKRF